MSSLTTISIILIEFEHGLLIYILFSQKAHHYLLQRDV